MKLKDIKNKIPEKLYSSLEDRKFDDLRPSQEKAIKKGLLDGKNLLVCTPTASGKTLVAELACIKNILENRGKAVYIVPLRALATEKYKDFKKNYPFVSVGISTGDLDKKEEKLGHNDLIIVTAEKLDSLIRHRVNWVNRVHTIVVDELHLINDATRGPTVEILITMLRHILKEFQIIGLSATIGNPELVASWLDAELVIDNWRPVQLKQGVYFDGEVEFVK